MTRTWWWPWGAVLVALLAVVVAGWVALFSPVLAVRTVEVVGEDQVSEQAVLDAASVRVGSALLRLDVDRVAQRVGALEPVADVDVVREWPGTVRIEVVEEQPVAVVRTGDGYGLLAPDGTVYRTVDRLQPALPLLDHDDSQVRSDPSAAAALEVVLGLPPRLARRVATVSATAPDEVMLRLRGGAGVAWGSAAQSARKAEVLLLLLDRHARRYDVSVPEAPVTSG